MWSSGIGVGSSRGAMTDMTEDTELEFWQRHFLIKAFATLIVMPLAWALLVSATIIFAATTPILSLASAVSAVESAARKTIEHLNQLWRKER